MKEKESILLKYYSNQYAHKKVINRALVITEGEHIEFIDYQKLFLKLDTVIRLYA